MFHLYRELRRAERPEGLQGRKNRADAPEKFKIGTGVGITLGTGAT